MEKILVRGGKTLSGTVKVEGAKNSVLPIMAAALLPTNGVSILKNVPALSDVKTISEVLKSVNVDVTVNGNTVIIDATECLAEIAPAEYVRKMRASFLVIGPMLARNGKAKVALPGGCAIGSRPVEIHIKALEAMGANITIDQGYAVAEVDGKLKGAQIYFDFPSVGATENIMMAASLAEGTTIIENAAQEPEIVDLANFINDMGGKISGAGTSEIVIEGVANLVGVEHTIISDRIESGTFMVAAAITGGNILVEGAVAKHLIPVIYKLKEMGVQVFEEENGLRVIGPSELKAANIRTFPHPGFPTDMQSQMMALLLKAKGTSVVTETVFENRFMHVEEFNRMNAEIRIEGHSVFITGGKELQGGEVSATDLRAAAALILAGLIAEGETTVTKLSHLDRGYVDFHKKLIALGADIERVSVAQEVTL